MHLTPSERDRLLLFTAAELARSRRARGLRLNVPEATALIAHTVVEAARDGVRLADAVRAGQQVLSRDEVLPGVPAIVRTVKVEAVFDDGTRLAVVNEPFGPDGPDDEDVLLPGAVLPAVEDRTPAHADVRDLEVQNTASVPISVTSHLHFFEANPRLRFDRAAAYGRRLAIDAGTAWRFEPGEKSTVPLVPIGGARVVVGAAGLVDGPLDAPGARERALERARACGYLDSGHEHAEDT
jgi:urease subunit gamma/beta